MDQTRARIPAQTIAERARADGEPATLRTLTPTQEAAIRAVMQLFLDDDLAAENGPQEPRWCDRCAASRPGAGAVRYDTGSVCNDCATAYELARAGGRCRSLAEFLDLPVGSPPAGGDDRSPRPRRLGR